MEQFVHPRRVQTLSRGTYGTVFSCIDENGRKFALKRCVFNGTGVPNIMELCLMRQYLHPYLNRASRIESNITQTSNAVRIFQELATSDISSACRSNIPDLNTLSRWTGQLIDAVYFLHSHGIIHGDIKGANLLLFPDQNIRLADFSLSFKKLQPDNTYTHNSCTGTHRPLECFLRQPWDEKIDIWSLGCTLFEMAYGQLLFPSQYGILDTLSQRDRSGHHEMQTTIIKHALINNLIDFSWYGPIPNNRIEMSQYPQNYQRFYLPELFHDPRYALFNDLLLRTLYIDPDKRASIGELRKHPFIARFVHIPGHVTEITQKITPQSYYSKLLKYCDDAAVIIIAGRIAAVLGIVNTDYFPAVLWLASKICYNSILKSLQCYKDDNMVEKETDLLRRLNYHLPLADLKEEEIEEVKKAVLKISEDTSPLIEQEPLVSNEIVKETAKETSRTEQIRYLGSPGRLSPATEIYANLQAISLATSSPTSNQMSSGCEVNISSPSLPILPLPLPGVVLSETIEIKPKLEEIAIVPRINGNDQPLSFQELRYRRPKPRT